MYYWSCAALFKYDNHTARKLIKTYYPAANGELHECVSKLSKNMADLLLGLMFQSSGHPVVSCTNLGGVTILKSSVCWDG